MDDPNGPRTSGEHGTSCSQRFGWRRGTGHSRGAEDRLSRQTGRSVSDEDIIHHRDEETDVFPLKLTGQCAELNSRVAGDVLGVQFNPVVLINSSLLGL